MVKSLRAAWIAPIAALMLVACGGGETGGTMEEEGAMQQEGGMMEEGGMQQDTAAMEHEGMQMEGEGN